MRLTQRLLLSILFLWQSAAFAIPINEAPLPLARKGVNGKVDSPGTWLGQNLEYGPYEELRILLEKKLGTPLKNRGEAHITVISPPEMRVLLQAPAPPGGDKLTATGIAELAKSKKLGGTDFDVICLGRGQKEKQRTYFVVVRAPEWIEFRKDLARRAGLPKDFRATTYYPHITLGFTDKDLHLQDGVIKDETSCVHWVKLQ